MWTDRTQATLFMKGACCEMYRLQLNGINKKGPFFRRDTARKSFVSGKKHVWHA